MSFRPGRSVAALAVAVFMITVFARSASATGTGTFSGTITPTSCGPMHDVPVVARALSSGRNGPDDLYADVDATRSFDYVLGSNKGGSSC